MKHVILIRHGKSSWNHNVGDVLRPLSERGVSDIKKIAKQFKLLEINPDAVFTSHAKRASHTCELFCEGIDYNLNDFDVVQLLYDFEGSQVIDFIKKLSHHIKVVLIFGHNNAFTNISNIFGSKYIDNVPTSGLVHLVFDIDKWENLKPGITKQTLFPKEL
ncbi:histidine phosphatase family protein [Paucihalobacter ruber]|uniref:phosphoglycerate mutase (2,3-diphosphoglycerate-dependent) n=1 Tax=Paucihalobacter ruber TaxID=2567861 RepID=A0A506PCK6_9FLAO|nr:phosphoglycerate mutase family protein [Paucihalobacter ruber]TPV31556.1 histidine phosphatase family protein [Paucihalobacter ruber]